MHKELELWQFIDERLRRNEDVMLLVVAESSGSSPGRAGYKMAIGPHRELIGSIGGGMMEVNLVEESLRALSNSALGLGHYSRLSQQVHRESSPHASGMICSGQQTVIFRKLTREDEATVESIIAALVAKRSNRLVITESELLVEDQIDDSPMVDFRKRGDSDEEENSKSSDQNPRFVYKEKLDFKDNLYIVGGGHCALALSELMSKMDFHISLFDDRPELNTIDKNRFAHVIKIVDTYERIGDHIPSGPSAYVVVMTLGYKTDEVVIRSLIDKEFKYFGVLGSKAKMAVMLGKLKADGISDLQLSRIRTPIGLPINSRSPEEIAVSIAAEIIAVKNG